MFLSRAYCKSVYYYLLKVFNPDELNQNEKSKNE